MAIITSIQNGNWSDTSTWDSGVVPVTTDEIIISAGHEVTLDVDFISHGTIRLVGTLIVSADVILRFGTYVYAAGSEGTLLLSGGTLTGAGSVYIRVGSVYTEEDAPWSHIKDLLYFGHEPSISGGRVSWDLNNVSFSGVPTLYLVSHPSGRERTVVFNIKNCIFIGESGEILYLGGRSGFSAQRCDFYITNCDFRGYTTVQCSAGSSAYSDNAELYNRIFRNCTFFGSDSHIMSLNLTDAGTTLDMIDCMFCNARPYISKSNLYRIVNCYVGHDFTGTAPGTTGSTHIDSIFSNSISHLPNRATVNFHMMAIFNAEHSYFEGWGTGGPNVLLRPNNTQGAKVVWKNNIMGGLGQFAASTSGNPTDYDISNNTIVSIGTQAMEVWMQETNAYVAVEKGCILRNNLQVCTATTAYSNGFTTSAGGITVDCPCDADYNCRWNMSGNWFRGYVTNSNEGLNNRDDINPMFVDPTREIEKWGQLVTGSDSADYKSVWDILLRKNGYDELNLIQDSSNTPSVGFTDLLTWLREGYRPTNIAMQTVGENGTYIGAIPVFPEEDVFDIDDDDTNEPLETFADLMAHISKTERLLREVITHKGVAVPKGTPFRQYARKVLAITSGATGLAKFSDVIEVKQANLPIGSSPDSSSITNLITLPE